MNFGDRILLVEKSGKLEAGTPGWLHDTDQAAGQAGMLVKTGDTVWVNAKYVREEQISLYTYRCQSLVGYMLMPISIWNFLYSAVGYNDKPVKTAWRVEYHSMRALMDCYQAQPLDWTKAVSLRQTVFEYTTLRSGVQPLYDGLVNEPRISELITEALERYERWAWYFKEQSNQ